MKQMFKLVKHKDYLGIGTNPKTMVPLVNFFFKRFIGKMNHFYMINNNFKKFKIFKNFKKKKIRINNSDYELKKISTFKELSAKN